MIFCCDCKHNSPRRRIFIWCKTLASIFMFLSKPSTPILAKWRWTWRYIPPRIDPPLYILFSPTILHHTTLHHTILHHTTQHYTTLHHTTQHYTTLHHTTNPRPVHKEPSEEREGLLMYLHLHHHLLHQLVIGVYREGVIVAWYLTIYKY